MDFNTNVSGAGLNNAGMVTGHVVTEGPVVPFRWTAQAGFELLPQLGAYGYAMAINDGGTAVGASSNPTLNRTIQATAWTPEGGMVQLQAGNPHPGVAVAVNRDGVIVGWVSVEGGANHAVVWKTGPGQPATDVPRANATVAAMAVSPGTVACLSDRLATVSRAAMFGCVSGVR
jgi:hypothetical protein